MFRKRLLPVEFLAVWPGTGVVGEVESDSYSGIAEAVTETEVRLSAGLRLTAECCQADSSSLLLK